MIFFKLFFEFFKIGLFTFGGGYAMIPLIKDVVLNYGWLTESQFMDFLGVCESTPGPVAINMATYIGSQNGGFFGSVCATLGVVLPSFIIILIIAAILKNLTENKYFKGFLEGVKPVITALITSTGVILLAKCIGYVSWGEFSLNLVSLICFVVLTVLYFVYKAVSKKKISAIMLIIISAVLGIVFSLIFNK